MCALDRGYPYQAIGFVVLIPAYAIILTLPIARAVTHPEERTHHLNDAEIGVYWSLIFGFAATTIFGAVIIVVTYYLTSCLALRIARRQIARLP